MPTPLRLALLRAALLAALLPVARSAVQVPSFTRWRRFPHDYPLPVWEAGGTILGSNSFGWHYVVFGGFNKFPSVTRRAYSARVVPGGRWRWTRLADMPDPLTHMAQASHGHLFFGVGGYRGTHPGPSSRAAWQYDRIADKWMRLPSLPAPRAGGGLLFYRAHGRRYLLYAGGVHRSKRGFRDYGTTWRLDLDALGRGWRDVKADMPHPRNHMGAVNSCGRFFWVGGQRGMDEYRGNSPAVTEFDQRRRKWRLGSVRRLPYGVGHVSASVLSFRCGILVVGGMMWGRKHSRHVLFWEPRRNRWHFVGKFPKGVSTPVCGLIGRRLVCGTGEGERRKEVFSTVLALKWAK